MNTLYSHANWSTSTNKIVDQTVKHGIKVHLWGFSKQSFGTLYWLTIRMLRKSPRNLQKALLSSTKRWFFDKNENWILGGQRFTTSFVPSGRRYYTELTVAVTRYKSNQNVWAYIKLRGKHISTLKQLSHEISDLESLTVRICRQISRKHASKMPDNYWRRWLDALLKWLHLCFNW